MSQITKIEQNLPSAGFLRALQGKLVKHATVDELAETVSAGIEKAWFNLGLKQPNDKKDKDALKLGVMVEIRSCFNTLTLDEIKAAIYQGARGRYGEVFGLNVIGVARWFAAYMTDQARLEARNELTRLTNPPVQPPTAAELADLKRRNILQAFAQFKQTGKYFDSANRIYDNLDAMGLIAFTPQAKREFMQQAVREFKEAHNPLRGRSAQERSAFRRASDKLLQAERLGAVNQDAAIIADAKRIALAVYFKGVVDSGLRMEEVLV